VGEGFVFHSKTNPNSLGIAQFVTFNELAAAK
jgi:hypothetical protein